MVEHSTEIAVAADAATLPTLQNWVSGQLQGQPPELTARVQLVVEELFANACAHGGRAVQVHFELHGDGGNDLPIRLVYVDNGPPFDPTSHVEQPREQPGGWGLSLIRQLPERCLYVGTEGQNRLEIDFSRQLRQSAGNA